MKSPARCASIPTFILLDEPFSGIDPIAVLDLQKIIFGLKESGIGVLITDHNVRETLSVVDRAYIINEGRIFRTGTRSSLATIPRSSEFTWARVSLWSRRLSSRCSTGLD